MRINGRGYCYYIEFCFFYVFQVIGKNNIASFKIFFLFVQREQLSYIFPRTRLVFRSVPDLQVFSEHQHGLFRPEWAGLGGHQFRALSYRNQSESFPTNTQRCESRKFSRLPGNYPGWIGKFMGLQRSGKRKSLADTKTK